MVDIADLDVIPRILLATDGAITHILEAYAGEPVDLVGLASSTVRAASAWPGLRADRDEAALRRVSLLRGRRTGRAFVHADAVVLGSRLPAGVADQLVRSPGTGLLPLLTGERIATFRESLGEEELVDRRIAAHLGAAPEEVLVARTYQVIVGGRPVARITESFPKRGFP
jgi:chorismate-pyruvate lyase